MKSNEAMLTFRLLYAIVKIAFITAKIIASLDFISAVHIYDSFQIPFHRCLTNYYCINTLRKQRLIIIRRILFDRHEHEKSHGESQNSKLKRRLKDLKEENEEILETRIQLIVKGLSSNESEEFLVHLHLCLFEFHNIGYERHTAEQSSI